MLFIAAGARGRGHLLYIICSIGVQIYLFGGKTLSVFIYHAVFFHFSAEMIRQMKVLSKKRQDKNNIQRITAISSFNNKYKTVNLPIVQQERKEIYRLGKKFLYLLSDHGKLWWKADRERDN